MRFRPLHDRVVVRRIESESESPTKVASFRSLRCCGSMRATISAAACLARSLEGRATIAIRSPNSLPAARTGLDVALSSSGLSAKRIHNVPWRVAASRAASELPAIKISGNDRCCVTNGVFSHACWMR